MTQYAIVTMRFASRIKTQLYTKGRSLPTDYFDGSPNVLQRQ